MRLRWIEAGRAERHRGRTGGECPRPPVDRSLTPELRGNVSQTRLAYLLSQAPAEVLRGLEPYGYYDAKVVPEVIRAGEQVTVRLAIELGDPVMVRELKLSMHGPGKDDAAVAARVASFHPLPGELFHHSIYEGSKATVARVLASAAILTPSWRRTGWK